MPQTILARILTPLQSSKYPFELQFSLHKCPKPSWQAFWPPTIKQIAHLNLDNSSLNKCSKPSWQALRPPSPNGQCPNWLQDFFSGASLNTTTSFHWSKNLWNLSQILTYFDKSVRIGNLSGKHFRHLGQFHNSCGVLSGDPERDFAFNSLP